MTHAARKRAKRAKAAAMAAVAEVEDAAAANDPQQLSKPVLMPWLPGVRGPLPPRGPFGDRVDRVFFFGDLNYRVDLSREDLELGVSACRQQQEAGEGGGREGDGRGRRIRERFRPGESKDSVGKKVVASFTSWDMRKTHYAVWMLRFNSRHHLVLDCC